MDDLGRFRCCMRFEPADRPPYWELLGAEPATIERWHDEGLPADEYFDAYFDLDRADRVPIDDGLLPPFVEEVRGCTDGVVTRQDALGRVVRERAGRLVEVVSYPLATRADLAALERRQDARSPRRFPRRWTDYLRCAHGRDYPLGIEVVGPLGRLIDLAGPQRTAALMAEEPTLVHDALDAFTRFLIDLLRPTLAGVGDVDFVILREALYGEALTAEAFAEWLSARYRAIVQAITDHRVETIIVVCRGDLRAVLGPLAEAGITALAPLTVAAGMDPLALRREHGQALALIGGIDARVLAQDCEAIEREVTRTVPALTSVGGWIPSLDGPAPPDVPLDNYRYYWELVRDLIEG